MATVVGEDDRVKPRAICYGCGSIVEYARSEAKQTKKNMDYLGDYDLVWCISCPKCGDDIEVRR